MYGIPHIATGDMIREMMARNTELGQQLREVYDRGDLVSDEQIIELIRDRLSRGDTIGGFVLDGFPRTMAQAEALDTMLDEIGKPLDAVLLLQVSDEVATARLRERAVQEGRADDSPEAIEKRLRLYHELTELVVDRYQHAGIEVVVDGEQPVDDVFAAVQDALEGVVARS